MNKPIAVSQYKHELPASLQNVLPSIEQLEAELATVEMIEVEGNDFDLSKSLPLSQAAS